MKNICKYVLFLDCSVEPVCSATSAVQGTTASCCLAGNRVSFLDVRLSLVTEVSCFQFSLYRCALIKLTQPASLSTDMLMTNPNVLSPERIKGPFVLLWDVHRTLQHEVHAGRHSHFLSIYTQIYSSVDKLIHFFFFCQRYEKVYLSHLHNGCLERYKATPLSTISPQHLRKSKQSKFTVKQQIRHI